MITSAPAPVAASATTASELRPISLAEQLEALRADMNAAAAAELAALAQADAVLRAADSELMRALHAAMADHARRRADIAGALQTFANRIGYVPNSPCVSQSRITTQEV